MYKNLVRHYVENFKKEEIIKFIKNNNYEVNNKEIEIIYFYIKNHWEDFYDNKEEIWQRLKNDVSKNTYTEIVKLFQKYKKFI